MIRIKGKRWRRIIKYWFAILKKTWLSTLGCNIISYSSEVKRRYIYKKTGKLCSSVAEVEVQQYLNSLNQSTDFSREYLHKIPKGESKHDKNNPQCLYRVPEKTVPNCENTQVLLAILGPEFYFALFFARWTASRNILVKCIITTLKSKKPRWTSHVLRR